MISRRVRSTSFASSVVAALSLAGAIAPAHAACETSLAATLGPRELAVLSSIVVGHSAAPVGANRAAPEREIASNSNETLPTVVRNMMVDPANFGSNFMAADLYLGSEYNSKSPDVFGIPRDARALCLLVPASAVFLSDDVTHHYATVYAVDFKKEVVTLADPWAQVSFLLPGRNLLGVAAHARLSATGKSLLDVSFKDMTRAMHGLLNPGRVAARTIEVIDKLYPEIAEDESYLFWRYAKPMSAGIDGSLMAMLELGSRQDLASKPRLNQLSAYANDLTIGVLSRFEGDGKKAAAQAAFLGRLETYAPALPWTLRWTLLQRARLSGDIALQLAIADAFLKVDARDMDIQIERAKLLLDLQRSADAYAQIKASRRQWDADVAASIAIKPAEKAVAAFFAHDYGRSQDQLFAWRYARLSLLEARAALMADPKAAVALVGAKLTDLDTRLGSRIRLRVAFFGELARIAHMTGDTPSEEGHFETIAQTSLSAMEHKHVSEAMFEHFTTVASIAALSAGLQKKLRASPLKPDVCDQATNGNILPDQQKPLVDALLKFCKAK